MDGREMIGKGSSDVSNMRKTDKSAAAEKLRKDSQLVMTPAELIAIGMIFRQ